MFVTRTCFRDVASFCLKLFVPVEAAEKAACEVAKNVFLVRLGPTLQTEGNQFKHRYQ